MSDDKDNRYAVLIDADNISDKYVKIVLDEISKDGIATYKRIYGDWTKPELTSWKNSLLDNSILPIQQYSYTTGKSATDSAMIIDAMDILYSGHVEGFCLVSSDSDFTRLAARLRESGMNVVGMGERKTPKAFIAACNQFKYLDVLAAAEPEPASEKETEFEPEAEHETEPAARVEAKHAGKTAKTAKNNGRSEAKPEYHEGNQTGLGAIRRTVRTIVAENSDEDDWMFIGKIGALLVKRYPDFDVRNYGYSKLTSFLKSLNLFEIKSEKTKDSNTRLIFVKLK